MYFYDALNDASYNTKLYQEALYNLHDGPQLQNHHIYNKAV